MLQESLSATQPDPATNTLLPPFLAAGVVIAVLIANAITVGDKPEDY